MVLLIRPTCSIDRYCTVIQSLLAYCGDSTTVSVGRVIVVMITVYLHLENHSNSFPSLSCNYISKMFIERIRSYYTGNGIDGVYLLMTSTDTIPTPVRTSRMDPRITARLWPLVSCRHHRFISVQNGISQQCFVFFFCRNCSMLSSLLILIRCNIAWMNTQWMLWSQDLHNEEVKVCFHM